MSDTAANPLDNIRVVLVGTLYTGNVGSSCRAMANMGIRHLRLAAPNLQNSWDEGERLAVHATDIMNAREEFATFEEAVADCVAVVGTTAREGLYRQLDDGLLHEVYRGVLCDAPKTEGGDDDKWRELKKDAKGKWR